VTLSLFGIFIFTSPFLRVLAVLISARWMVLKAYGRKMETHGKCESYLVASSDIDLESAIRCAYNLGSADKIGDTASLLRQEINDMLLGQFPASMRYSSTYILPNGIN
jgi:hypothetical protein